MGGGGGAVVGGGGGAVIVAGAVVVVVLVVVDVDVVDAVVVDTPVVEGFDGSPPDVAQPDMTMLTPAKTTANRQRAIITDPTLRTCARRCGEHVGPDLRHWAGRCS